MHRTFATLIAVLTLAGTIAGCGRTDIEDSQRGWLDDQYALERRLLDVQRELDDLRRRADIRRAGDVVDSISLHRLQRSDTALQRLGERLAELDSMIDRHSLARDNAIRADDAAAVDTGWSAAKIDYAAARAELDAIDNEIKDLARDVGAIQYRALGDTIGSNDVPDVDAARDTGASSSGDKSKPPVIDNKIGREEPLEPE